MSYWTLNDATLESLGLTLAAGNFRVQGISTMTLDRAADFDATPILSYGAAVILACDGTPFFQGKVASVPTYASGSQEGQAVEVADAWGDLEETIYQEEWNTGTTAILQPRAVLGLGEIGGTWTYLTVAQQVRKIMEYAISQGVALQIGYVPTGERLLPTEIANVSCAEAIQMALKYHPDWIPWIDHSTTPPTFNVTPIGSAAGAAFAVDGTGPVEAFEVTSRSDLLPASVRIVYESADVVDGEVWRKVYVDKYPADGPDGGPQVLTASIPLEGMQMQIQKTRIQSRLLPTSSANAVAWLKEQFPVIAAIPDADLFCDTWALELVAENPLDFPPAISPQVSRMTFAEPEECTHQLLRGTIEDWMYKKVGPVRVYFHLTARPTVSALLRRVVEALPSELIITGTDAATKTYKSVAHWSPAESVPTGIAQAVYDALHAAMPYQGSVTISAPEMPLEPYHGRVISLPPTWPGMTAPVHSVDWDVASGTMTLGFGPAPHLAPADFLELQRILRARPVTWWSFDERDSGKFGYEAGPSARGDTVGGHDAPKADPVGPLGIAEQFRVSDPFFNAGDATWHVRVNEGYVLGINPEPGLTNPMGYATCAAEADLTITAGDSLYVKVSTDHMDLVDGAVIHKAAAVPSTIHAQPDPDGNDGEYYYEIATFTTVGGVVVLEHQQHLGGPILHRPSRNNRNADLIIHQYTEDTDGVLTETGSPIKMSFRQGLYVGLEAGPADNLTEFHALNLVEE